MYWNLEYSQALCSYRTCDTCLVSPQNNPPDKLILLRLGDFGLNPSKNNKGQVKKGVVCYGKSTKTEALLFAQQMMQLSILERWSYSLQMEVSGTR